MKTEATIEVKKVLNMRDEESYGLKITIGKSEPTYIQIGEKNYKQLQEKHLLNIEKTPNEKMDNNKKNVGDK